MASAIIGATRSIGLAMSLSPRLRKLVLFIHLACSVGWIGGVVVYIGLGVAAATSQDLQTVRAAWIAMELSGSWVLIPMSVGALVTGVVLSLGTAWGLFRHYWILVSLGVTTLCSLVLIRHMSEVTEMAEIFRHVDGAGFAAAQAARTGAPGDLAHSSFGLVLLLVVMALNVYKPRGLTPYGRRKLVEERAQRAAPATRGELSRKDAPPERGIP